MKRYGKTFWATLLVKQNGYHKFGVLLHTLAVTTHLIRRKNYKMIPAGLLHDIGKMYVAYHDDDDIKEGKGHFSFHNHEEVGYHIIKNWWISDYTKNIVRHHYLIRSLKKEKKRNLPKYRRLKRIWDKLDRSIKTDLKEFLICDDLGKTGFINKT